MNRTMEHFTNRNNKIKFFSNSEFTENMEFKLLDKNYKLLSEADKDHLDIIRINFQRMKRIKKTFKENDRLKKLIMEIDKPQIWLVITEDWCGDSAQNIPYFYEYARLNDKITFQIILRDDNLESLESYFTSGNPKSIPKVVGFDEKGNEIFIWGARPKIAQDLVMQWKAEGFTKDEFNQKLHLWYGRNKGKELENEMIELLSKKQYG